MPGSAEIVHQHNVTLHGIYARVYEPMSTWRNVEATGGARVRTDGQSQGMRPAPRYWIESVELRQPDLLIQDTDGGPARAPVLPARAIHNSSFMIAVQITAPERIITLIEQ